MVQECDIKFDISHFLVRLALLEDVKKLVELHLATFTPHEHLLIVFGTSVLRPVYRWFVRSPDTFTMVATVKDEVVGLCTACSRPYNGPMIRNNAISLVLGVLRHPWGLFHPEIVRRLRKACSFSREGDRTYLESEPPAQLGFLAVRKDYHGTSVGESLVRQAITECGRRKWTRIRAGIYKNNLPARFMYAKLGFKENRMLRSEQLVFVELDLDI
jgi:ribosomal protein S18 acetylase RimI-like enzyme